MGPCCGGVGLCGSQRPRLNKHVLKDGDDIPQAVVRFDEARQFADAVSILSDLGFVIDSLSRLIDLLSGDDVDGVLARALWTSALVVYVRCFATGKRAPLTDEVFDGIRGPEHSAAEVHSYFKNMRDKHIAHSVNPFEQVTVALMLSPETADHREVEGVGTLTMHQVSGSSEGAQSLLELARIAHRKTSEKAQQLQAAVLAKGETLPIDDLYELARMKLNVPGPEAASKARP